jgi:Domain of unknown function (DUF4382)
MTSDFDRILDECIDRVNRGETVKACLSDYPEHAKRLEALLAVMAQTKAADSFTTSADKKRTARQSFYSAMEKTRQSSLFRGMLARPLIWATIIAVLVVLVIGYFALRTTIFPTVPPSITVTGSSAQGNFVFQVTDEVNAIADFSKLEITVDKISLLQTGNSNQWVEFTPATTEFDLTLLPDGKTQELWQGNIPEGNYSKEDIYVSAVQGILKASGDTIQIKLPSNKLELAQPFQVSANNTTSFTYDLTVVKAGNAQGGGKYLLKPQLNGEGVNQTTNAGNDKNKVLPVKKP